MDWGFSTSAPSSNNDRPAASGGWSDSDDDNFSSYETTQTLAIEKTILAVEDELYAIALTTNPNFPPPARISTPNPTTDDNNYADTSPEAGELLKIIGNIKRPARNEQPARNKRPARNE